MKIAVPTNDGVNVAERSGRARNFAVIEVDNNKIESIVFLENNHEETHHSGKHGSKDETAHGHKDLVDLLKGINVIAGKKFGPHFSRDFHQAGIDMRLSENTVIEEIALEIYNSLKK